MFARRIIFLSTNSKCHVTNIYTERKYQSIILHSFARKTKVSYYITFFQTLLRMFSCDLCYSDRRIILSYCEKRKVNYYVCKKKKIYSFQRTTKCPVTNIYSVEEKQKYHITSRSSKLSRKRFLLAFVILM